MQKSNSGFDRDILQQIATLAAIVSAFVINVISNIWPLNGLSIGEISNTLFRNVLVIPANYAFAIWGLIYLGLFALAVYQVLPAQRQQPDLRQIRNLLVIASIAQIIWVYLFLSKLFTLSVISMLGILLPLIAVYLKLDIGKTPVHRAEKWFVHLPISIYLGWISTATIVNVASALYYLDWNGWGISAQVWTAILILVATAIAAIIAIQHRDIAYTGVTVWALVAIAVKQWQQNPILRIEALVCAIVLGIIIYVKNSRSLVN